MVFQQRKGGQRLFYFLAAMLLSAAAKTQFTANSFRHLTTAEGLSDNNIHAVVQDKYGFTWIGTSYGLHRFDGVDVNGYFHKQNDRTTLPDNYVSALYRDDKGWLWAGTLAGLCRYDYPTATFISYSSPKPVQINDMVKDKRGKLWLATNDGLWLANEEKQCIQKFCARKDSAFQAAFKGTFNQLALATDGTIYIASGSGIKIFHSETFAFSQIRHDAAKNASLLDDNVISLALDKANNLWAAPASKEGTVQKISIKTGAVLSTLAFPAYNKGSNVNYITRILVDDSNRLWLTTTANGLLQYNEGKNTSYNYRHDALIANTVSANNIKTLYRDSAGLIWLGTEGYGLNFFHPDKNIFYALHASEDKRNSLPDDWCRAACEDDKGNLWLATGRGAARYNPRQQRFTLIANTESADAPVYYNSIRSLLKDDEGNVWIGTSKGLNRYHPSTGKMDFFGKAHGIPAVFVWMMAKRKDDEIWFGTREGLFRYRPAQNAFDDLSSDPILSSVAKGNIQALFTDSKNRLWIAILDVGVVVYDGKNSLTLLSKKNKLLTDDRTSSFAEDKNGAIWIGSEEGLTAYDPAKGTAVFYTHENGLPSNRTNNIMCDGLNRIWIGTSNGLCVLDRNRKRLRRFNSNDGLLTNQFNEQAAYQTKDGYFVYPSYKGFLIFRPDLFTEDRAPVPFYLTSFTIAGTAQSISPNPQEVRQVHLKYDENFFTIGLAGLHFLNPQQCLFAYKLEPFDKDWVYTANREIKYTNVPAGDYVFHYKAATDSLHWAGNEKTLEIKIDSVFYKTVPFRLFAAALIAALLYGLYKYRGDQRAKLANLQTKATALEKEKAVVMYENLKQQLNPHFLFNSLSSLSGLIQKDQGAAKTFLDQLSKIYRYILKSGDSETVRISEDLKLAQIYMQLQQTRFGNGLQLLVDLPDDVQNRKIAPVTIQNLIENAIKHNVIDSETPLVIAITYDENFLIVQNNLQKKSFVEGSNKQGLRNMKTLYRYLCGQSIVTEENAEYFTVKIPFV